MSSVIKKLQAIWTGFIAMGTVTTSHKCGSEPYRYNHHETSNFDLGRAVKNLGTHLLTKTKPVVAYTRRFIKWFLASLLLISLIYGVWYLIAGSLPPLPDSNLVTSTNIHAALSDIAPLRAYDILLLPLLIAMGATIIIYLYEQADDVDSLTVIVVVACVMISLIIMTLFFGILGGAVDSILFMTFLSAVTLALAAVAGLIVGFCWLVYRLTGLEDGVLHRPAQAIGQAAKWTFSTCIYLLKSALRPVGRLFVWLSK